MVFGVLTAVVFQLTAPSNDYWGEYGAYGPCSRPCGTGVAMRTRAMYHCKACPVGSRDIREEQCAQFDRMDFQSKRYTWLPYHGASNPCELNCVPRGENFFYRHRPAVVDGTPCNVGRSDICIEGICRAVSNGEILGMDRDVVPAPPAPATNLRHRESLTYAYTYSAWSECSAPCNGGTQHRSVQCMVQDSTAPHVVDDSYCISQGLPRPASQQACNQQQCAEYSVSSYSGCSVTCGDGQQTREVFCVGAGGEHLGEQACSGLTRPPTVQACHNLPCHTHISWHVNDFGLVYQVSRTQEDMIEL
ncbi:unnamed protein product [Coregonus sp. 'balchen']|nr:unnamed protein product [Coregonus sp. 'balchen']